MQKINLINLNILLFLICGCSTNSLSSNNLSNILSNSTSSSQNIENTSTSTSIKDEENNSSSSIVNSNTSLSKDEDDNNVIIVNEKSDINQDEFYNEFFDYKSNIEMTLKFTNKAIYNLAKYSDDRIKKEMYHPCDLEIKMNDTTYIFNESGARMKGNTSRNSEFVNEDGTFNAPVHFKVSVNQTFDDEEDNDYYIRTWDNDELRNKRKKRRIGASKKFDIKYNKNEDNTFTRQIYAYNCYENEGLVSQKNNLVKVNIESETDKMTMLYELQECIDSEFIERRYNEEEASGNLYKCTYTDKGPANLTTYANNEIGVEYDNYHPVYDLKTNDEEEDHTLLKNVIDTLNNDTRPANEFKDTFDNIINAEEFIKFAALSWVIGNPDDIRNNSNNYYIYFNSLTNKATFIPYDYDRCFGILKDWEIHTEEIPHYTTKQNTGRRSWQPNPIYWRTIISTTDNSVDYSKKWEVISEYQELYNKLCLEYANKYLDVNKYKEFNNQFVYSNKDIENGGANNLSFEAYCTRKLQTFEN